MPIPILNAKSIIRKTETEVVQFSNFDVRLYLSAKKPYAIVSYSVKSSPSVKNELRVPLTKVSFYGKPEK